MIRSVFCFVLAGWLSAASFIGPCYAQDLNLTDLQQKIYQVVEKTTPAIVEITRRRSVFSGVIVSPQGHVLTAGHTVEPGHEVSVVLPDGRRLRGRCLGACEQMQGEQYDCGLIKLDDVSDLPFVEMGASASLQALHPCLSISYPGGQRNRREPMVRFGHVNGSVRPGRMIKSTALMEPGDSGGPLLDLEGRLIGIHSRITAANTENFDVPIDAFKEFWDQLNVPNRFYIQNKSALPKLGFVGEDDAQQKAIRIISLANASVAKKLDLRPGDYLQEVHGKKIAKLSELQRVLLDVIREKPESVKVSVRRGDQTLELTFTSADLNTPKAERIAGINSSPTTQVRPIPQLPRLASNLSQLENRLDDSCCPIYCTLDGNRSEFKGTMIADSNWIVSKNSLLGEDAWTVSGGKRLDLTPVARDELNDLVLLKSPEKNVAGVRFQTEPNLKRGKFLLTPDPFGDGVASVLSSATFKSDREASRGYLGVNLDNNQNGGVVLREVHEGAAQRAGLQIGDVILKVNDQTVLSKDQVHKYLQSQDPNSSIRAVIRRETTEFEKEIRLGIRPTESDHAADMMDKSLRRDGFNRVFCHDAWIKPDNCGSPVFDLEGNFYGINIARHSRVRTFVLPAAEIKKLIDRTTASVSP